jgi:GT2 family glycosyltransferase
MTRTPTLAAIAIGRNEGRRLDACLASLAAAGINRVVYVDSGSTDGSPDRAADRGAKVVQLDPTAPFTAARGRNAGLSVLSDDPPEFVQLIDGDCTLDPDWLPAAMACIGSDPALAIVFGRRRERHPEKSAYIRLCDREWNTPLGPAAACGGDALVRHAALAQVGGFDSTLIAGEEPDLCLRLRRIGWRIERIDAQMTLHDAAITRFGQFWRRARRAGHAFAEGHWRHRHGPEGHFRRETFRAILWGAALPAAVIVAAAVVSPVVLLLLLAYPAQMVRLAAREGFTRAAFEAALLLTIAKFAEASGVIGYHLSRLLRRRTPLIEYK